LYSISGCHHSRVARLALPSRPRFRAFTPLTPRSFAPGWHQRYVDYTRAGPLCGRRSRNKPPKVPASIIPFVLDNVTEARPADQVICRRNLAGTWGNIAETDSSASEFTWTTGEDSLNCPQRPLAFAFGQLLSCQTRPMKVRLVRGRGLEGQRARYVGVCAAAVNCAQLAR